MAVPGPCWLLLIVYFTRTLCIVECMRIRKEYGVIVFMFIHIYIYIGSFTFIVVFICNILKSDCGGRKVTCTRLHTKERKYCNKCVGQWTLQGRTRRIGRWSVNESCKKIWFYIKIYLNSSNDDEIRGRNIFKIIINHYFVFFISSRF